MRDFYIKKTGYFLKEKHVPVLHSVLNIKIINAILGDY